MAATASLPYHEPGITAILIQSSFVVLLNAVNAVLDRAMYCGLLGQIFVGVAWGTPGAKWIAESTEETVVQLGYLGLILLVYEGGLSTSFASLRANLLLSSAVAATGIAVPIALSFALQGLADATLLQAFAAGAALCSTSLGTTFTVLATSGLTKSRLGVVLTSAAMMDDVIGLVMVQVISNLGASASSFNATTAVIRPVLVSLAFAVIVPLVCRVVVRPLTVYLNGLRAANPTGLAQTVLSKHQAALAMHSGILLGLVAGGSYGGTSNLFTAYLAGASISWWDTEVPHLLAGETNPTESEGVTQSSGGLMQSNTGSRVNNDGGSSSSVRCSGLAVYETYYQQAVERILKPLFFASIGFSIPISRMFTGAVVWRGIVYTTLMVFGKLVCGLWLIRFSISPYIPSRLRSRKLRVPKIPHLWGASKSGAKATPEQKKDKTKKRDHAQPSGQKPPANERAVQRRNSSAVDRQSESPQSAEHEDSSVASRHTSPDPRKPISLYPASIIGGAMVARGEIGFLISSLAESKGIFSSGTASSDGSNEVFLVVTWAIMLCTIIGPLSVGMLVRRVKKLQGKGENAVEGRRDVLGVWGVE